MQLQLTVGRVSGTEHDGVVSFVGMPYARAQRFEAPHATTWDGVFDAGTWGPDAPQNPGSTFLREGVTQAEDCLRVNVWTPSASGKRPVMVWIHGGGFLEGSSSLLSYDGAELARRGDVVVVSLNYRLGALGFIVHPELTRGDGRSGNWGLLDQIEGLKWVQREIAAFGGDPGNVTLFGESAGGGSVTLLMCSPLARGLFQRAICQSGAPIVAETAYVTWGAEELAKELGTSIVGLKQAPIDVLLKAQRKVEQSSRATMVFLPVVDGEVLERMPLDVFGSGEAAQVPLLIGTNTDEYRLFATVDRHSRHLTDEQLEQRVSPLLQRETSVTAFAGVIETYRRERGARGLGAANHELWYAIKTDEFFRVRARRVASRHCKQQPTFMYLFSHGSPLMGGWMGAAHGVEIPFVFGTYRTSPVDQFTGTGPRADAVCDRMLRSWVAFARSGDPSTDDLAWPAFDDVNKFTMLLDAESRVESAPAEAEVAMLEAYLRS